MNRAITFFIALIAAYSLSASLDADTPRESDGSGGAIDPVFNGARQYHAIELPNLLEPVPSFAEDINDHGTIVGVTQMTIEGETFRPWMWNVETGMINLLPFFGFTWFASATDINNNGEVMGMYADGCFEPNPHPECPEGFIPFEGLLRAVLWATDGSGAFTEVPSPASSLGLDNLGVRPGALSESGVIGGAAIMREPGEFSFGFAVAILWDQVNDPALLVGRPMADFTILNVTDINDTGQYCGQVLQGNEARGYFFDPDTGYTILPRLSDPAAGIEYANAIAINNHGQVVGYADLTQIIDDVVVTELYGAYVWDQVNGMQFLGEYTVSDINDQGQIVGSEPPAPPDNFPHAVLHENGTWYRIQDFTDVDTSNWRLAYARAINHHGQIAVNALAMTEAQILASGEVQPFLLTPTGSPGDLNLDGKVNEDDRSLLCAALGSVLGGPNFFAAADLNHDQAIDELDQQLFNDILPPCAGDVVSSATFQPPADGITDGADLAYLLGAWGSQPSCADMVTSTTFAPPPDGVVDGADLAFMLGAWGPCP